MSVDCDTVSADPWHIEVATGLQMSECWSGTFPKGTGLWLGPGVNQGISIYPLSLSISIYPSIFYLSISLSSYLSIRLISNIAFISISLFTSFSLPSLASVVNHQWQNGDVGIGNNGVNIGITGGLMANVQTGLSSSVAGEPTIVNLRP